MADSRAKVMWASGLAAALLALGAPLPAQTAPATNSATPAPTSAPSPAPADGSAIGPRELRDFSINGTVTRRAEPTAPAPAPAADATPAPARPAPSPTPSATAPARTTATVAAPDRDSSAERVTLDLPPPTPAAPDRGMPGFGDVPLATPAPVVQPAEQGGFPWAWLLAAVAAALAAGYFVWRKLHAGEREAYVGLSERLSAPQGATPELTPRPMPMPRPAPRASAPAAVPPPAPPTGPVADTISSTTLKPKLDFELRPIRAETDDGKGAALLFDVIVINSGHAPARDVLVEATLFNAGPKQDEEIGRFFREPVGRGDRLPLIPPMGRISLKSKLSIPGDKMQPVEIEGRQLFVPLVAFNALYRWNGNDRQESASFLVGRGDGGAGKMAPFRLDQGAKSWTGLGARPHSMGLQR